MIDKLLVLESSLEVPFPIFEVSDGFDLVGDNVTLFFEFLFRFDNSGLPIVNLLMQQPYLFLIHLAAFLLKLVQLPFIEF